MARTVELSEETTVVLHDDGSLIVELMDDDLVALRLTQAEVSGLRALLVGDAILAEREANADLVDGLRRGHRVSSRDADVLHAAAEAIRLQIRIAPGS